VTKPPKGGRPTKLTPEVRERILSILSVGGTWKMAAAAGGISDDTLKRHRDANEGFAAACARARDSGAAALVEKIRNAAEGGDWRASAWLLERISPEVYGRRVVVGGPDGGPVKVEGELRVAGEIRANVDATKKLHDAIAAAAGTSK
jgi:hypothetical protein